MRTLLWLRRDLRRLDLPALHSAREAGDEVAVVFVIDPALWGTAGDVRRAWVAANVQAAAQRYDGRLLVRSGDPATVIPALVRELDAGSVHVSAETTPYGAARDRRVADALEVPLSEVIRVVSDEIASHESPAGVVASAA